MLGLLYRLLAFLVRVATLPLWPLVWLVEWTEGVPQLRRERQRMAERPPLSDGDLVRSLGLSPEEAPIWLAFRRAAAAYAELPATAVYPDDPAETLFRLMRIDTWLVFDWSDVIESAAGELGIDLSRGEIGKRLEQVEGRDARGRFRDLAAALTTVFFQAPRRAAVE